MDSLFGQEKLNSVYYKASSPTMETPRNHGVIGNGGGGGGGGTNRNNLFKGLKVDDGIYSSQGDLSILNRRKTNKASSVDVPLLQKQVDDLKEINKKLVGSNNDLHRTLSEKEKIGLDFSNLQSKYHNLESLYNNTKEELEMCQAELQVTTSSQDWNCSLQYFFSAESEK